jgi:hypothetical protein
LTFLLVLLACSGETTTDTGTATIDDTGTVTGTDTGGTTDTLDTSDTTDTTDTVDTAPSAPIRGMWVWDTAIPGDAEATTKLLDFSAERGVKTLFLACDPVGYGTDGAVERYTDFVATAHAADLEVYGMSGYGWFTLPCDAGLSGQPTCWTEGWDVYETCAASGVGFDGIMDDSEPASVAVDHFFEHYDDRARWTVQYLQGIQERIGDLPLHHALPAWYDDRDAFAMTDGGPEKTLDAWIAETVEVAAVMSYRDTASAVIEIAATELTHGPAWVGLEISDAGEGDHVDFSEEGAAAMQVEIEAIEAQLTGDPGFHGVMVHSYSHWVTAAENE